PLDGGRLLSSILWWRTGSRQRGVHNAVRVGRVFAYLMIAAGVLELFLGEVANGIWIAFLGWFLLSAAASEEAGSAVRTLLRSVPVSAAMTSPVVTLPDWVTVEQFLESVAPNHSFTTYPVHEPSGKLTGVVRLSDLVRLPASDRASKHLIEVARPIADVPTTNPREDLSALIQRVGMGLEQRVLGRRFERAENRICGLAQLLERAVELSGRFLVGRTAIVALQLSGQVFDIGLESVPRFLCLLVWHRQTSPQVLASTVRHNRDV